MAQYHAHGSISHNACLTFAYDCRDEIVDPNTGKKANYTYKEDLLYSNSFMAEYAPQTWTENPALCWLSVAENEGKITANGKQAQHARKVEFALPKELSQEKAIEACDEFAKSMQKKGMCVSYGLHKTSSGNIHCHCMMTLRKLDKNGKWEKNKFKSQYVYEQKKDENGKPIFENVPVYVEDENKLDENGKPLKVQKLDENGKPKYEKKPVYVVDENGKPKKIPQLDENGQQKFRERPGKGREMLWVREVIDVNEWNDNDWYKTNVRKKIETICNDKLKEIGSTERVDCRSYKERGINKTPTIHEGCYSDTAIRQLFNKQIRERNQKEESWEQLAAELKERIAAEAVKVAEPIIDIPAAAADQTQELRPASAPAVNSGEPNLQTTTEKMTAQNAPTSAEVEPVGMKVPLETEEKDLVSPPVSPAQPERRNFYAAEYFFDLETGDFTGWQPYSEPEIYQTKPQPEEVINDGKKVRVVWFDTLEELQNEGARLADELQEDTEDVRYWRAHQFKPGERLKDGTIEIYETDNGLCGLYKEKREPYRERFISEDTEIFRHLCAGYRKNKIKHGTVLEINSFVVDETGTKFKDRPMRIDVVDERGIGEER